MSLINNTDQTICALSTPNGIGGISVIRVSGNKSLKFVTKLCKTLPSLKKIESHKVYFGKLISSSDQLLIDEVLISYFADKKSFTGEETIEISCHGSPAIVSTILDELISFGCRMADKGEFSFRAFNNGKIDLIQAEGILSLIESQSKVSAKVAARQLKGELSAEINNLYDSLTWILANAEASIDFSEEDISPSSLFDMKNKAESTLIDLNKFILSYNSGRLLKEGLQITIVGSPNAGKSSLLNFLLKEEKSIVTNIPGTTRDLVDGRKMIAGVEVNFTDTAGLRNSNNEVEKIGIEKAKNKIIDSDIILYIYDSSKKLNIDEIEFIQRLDSTNTILIGNKSDLASSTENDFGKDINVNEFLFSTKISVVKESGLQNLVSFFENYISQKVSGESSVIVNSRHYEQLVIAKKSLKKSIELIENNESPEFIAFELQGALNSVANILGKNLDDSVLDRVFKEFCIGK